MAVSTTAVLLLVVAALSIGYAVGRVTAKRRGIPAATAPVAPPAASTPRPEPAGPPVAAPAAAPRTEAGPEGAIAERARVIRSLEAETATLRRALAARDAALVHLADLAADRSRLYLDLANARAGIARYRQLVVDLENNAPPPFFGAGAPDDLKLIVGVGPVLERMLQQLGVTTYRQIARWSERDIDEFDAKLPEFPGRIRRDAWVTQARALHQSKYGAPPSARAP
jgi:predicted flap endonuclease-1-like 5' DNA nuclease